jgi:hypothetical protein
MKLLSTMKLLYFIFGWWTVLVLIILILAIRSFYQNSVICTSCGERIQKEDAWCADEDFYRTNTTIPKTWYCKNCV